MVSKLFQFLAVPAASTHSVKLILNTALWLTALGLVVRASGAVKEIIFAGAFGVSSQTDAFVLASTYAILLPTVLGGAIGTVLVAYVANMQAGSPAERSLRPVIKWVGAAAVLAVGLIYVLAPVVVSGLFSLGPEDSRNAIAYSRILAPLGATIILSSAMDALLNSAKQFYVPAITALGTPLTAMASIVLFGALWGVEAAAWGMVAGGVAEVLVLSLRVGAQRNDFFGRDRSQVERPKMAVFWRPVGLLSLAGAISALAPMVDQVFLSKLETGTITNFNYAYKVNSLLIGILGSAFSVVIYPYLSDLAAARNTAGLKRLCLKLAAVALPITAAISLFVYAFSYEIVELLFLRGNFTQGSAVQVSAIQKIFAFQLVFYIAGLMAMRVLNATRATDFVLRLSCIALLSTVVFDWLFYAELGARGIALSAVLTSVMSLVSALFFIRLVLADRGKGGV